MGLRWLVGLRQRAGLVTVAAALLPPEAQGSGTGPLQQTHCDLDTSKKRAHCTTVSSQIHGAQRHQ